MRRLWVRPSRLVPTLCIGPLLLLQPAEGTQANIITPDGCRPVKVTVTHTAGEPIVLTLVVVSECATPNGGMICTTEWKEDKEGRKAVDITCDAATWSGP